MDFRTSCQCFNWEALFDHLVVVLLDAVILMEAAHLDEDLLAFLLEVDHLDLLDVEDHLDRLAYLEEVHLDGVAVLMVVVFVVAHLVLAFLPTLWGSCFAKEGILHRPYFMVVAHGYHLLLVFNCQHHFSCSSHLYVVPQQVHHRQPLMQP